jgi:predicted ATPase
MRFSSLAEQGLPASTAGVPEGGEDSKRLKALLEAELLYRGEFLEGFYLDDAEAFEEWQLAEAERLVSLAASVEAALARLALRAGDFDAAEGRARKAIAVAPFFELGHCILLESLAARGDSAAAREHAAAYRAQLRREREREPGPAFSSLLGRICGQGPAGPPLTGTPSGPSRLDAVPPMPCWAPSQALPSPRTSFIGREKEVAEVAVLLRRGGLLSLLGPGGVGKTRLAIEAAARKAADFPEGAVFADLVPCTRDADVAPAIAAALGLRLGTGGAACLPDYLATRSLILVLDNCEHVVEGAADTVARIVSTCTDIAVIATSRERLGIPGETVYEVPSLAMPPGNGKNQDRRALEAEAPRLLIDRCRSSQAGWSETSEEAGDLVAICARLDALPLAIELAAVRLPGLGAAGMRKLLESRLSAPLEILGGGIRTDRAAHRALRALFDGSWETLDARGREAFPRLSVFRGQFSLDAAVAICGPGSERTLSDLAEKRLVVPVKGSDGSARFRLLETVRSYAAARLEEAAGLGEARRSHLTWYSAEADRLEDGLRACRSLSLIEGAALDMDEFEAALRYAIELPDFLPVAAGMCRALVELFSLRGMMTRLGRVLGAIGDRERELGQGKALADYEFALGHVFLMTCRTAEAIETMDRAAELYLGCGETLLAGYALAHAGVGSGVWGEGDWSRRRAEAALGIFREQGSAHGLADAFLAKVQFQIGPGQDLAEAEAALEEGLPYAIESGSLALQARYWLWSSQVAEARHDWSAELQCLDRCDRLGAALDDPSMLGESASFRARAENMRFHPEAALEAARESLRHWLRTGDPIAVARSMIRVTTSLCLLDRLDEAIAQEEEALSIVTPLANREEINYHRYAIACIEVRRGNARRSLGIGEELVDSVRPAADTIELPRALMRLGRLQAALGTSDKAIGTLMEAERHPRSGYLRDYIRAALACLDPMGNFPFLLGKAIRTWLSTDDDDLALAAIGMGLRLSAEGRTDPGLGLAGRGLAFLEIGPELLFRLRTRQWAAQRVESLRASFGNEAVDAIVLPAAERYRENEGAFFAEAARIFPLGEEALLSLNGHRGRALQ